MPRVNGFEALAQLKAELSYQPIPVVMLTTSSNDRDEPKAVRLGANGFLTKPPSMPALLNLVDRLVRDWQLVSRME